MKSNAVKREHYELYNFNIPFILQKSKREKFLFRELEKCHPCFGQTSSVDSHLYLKKGTLFARVAVMDQVRLLEYQSKNPFGLKLEGGGRRR